MKPLRIFATNYRTWDELDLQLPDGIAAVVGPNGAGKSSLVNVVDLALFGAGRELKRALTRGAGSDTVEVGVEFEHGGDVYRVRRSYKTSGAGKPRLDLERMGEIEAAAHGMAYPGIESLTRETITATDELLGDILGLSRATFRASSFLAQGDGAAFTEAEPRDRKAILLEALGVALWDDLRSLATSRRASHETELGKLVAKAEAIEGSLAHRDANLAALDAAEQSRAPLALAVADLEGGIAERRRELDEAQEKLAAAGAAREKAQGARHLYNLELSRAAALRERVNEATAASERRTELAAKAKAEPILAELVEVERDAADLNGAAARMDAAVATAEREQTEAERQVDLNVDAAARIGTATEVCPTCKRPLEGEALEAAMRELAERRKVHEEARDHWLGRATEAAARGQQHARERDRLLAEREGHLRRIMELREPLPDANKIDPAAALVHARACARDLAGLEERLAAADAVRRELDALEGERLPALLHEAEQAERLVPAADDVVPITTMRRKIAEAESTLALKRDQLTAAERNVAGAEAVLERLDAMEDELGEVQVQRERATETVIAWKHAERAYGRDGVPALLIERFALPQLEASANTIIAELGRPYRFELRTQRATQAGTVKEALDIVVTTDTGEALYEDFSGGERTRLDLALRIALARLLAARRGADVRFLAIDEPAYLDDEGFEALAKVLQGLAGEFEVVLVVSHVEALRDAFDTAIPVGGGADTGEPSRLEEVPV